MVTYEDIVYLVGFKVVNHWMAVMPLRFFFCNKQKDSKILWPFCIIWIEKKNRKMTRKNILKKKHGCKNQCVTCTMVAEFVMQVTE